MQDLKLSIIQSDLIWEDIQANIDVLDQKINQIPDEVDLIVLPEAFNTGFPVDPEKFAETYEGKTLSWMKAKAAEKNTVITGSLLIEENAKYYNMLVWMQPDGRFETYAKRHLFHLGEEADTISPGQKQLVCELKEWKIKPLICYDLRFPVWSKNTFDGTNFEYDLLIYVANWPSARMYPWRQLLIARALENQSYVVGLNRIGKDEVGNTYTGESIIVDPKGQIFSDIPKNNESIFTTSLSAKMMNDFRKKFNVGYDWDQFKII